MPAPLATREGAHPMAVVMACGFALLWIGAFLPEPQVLATVPGVLGLLWAADHVQRKRTMVLVAVVFGGLGIGFGYRWLAATMESFSNGMVGPVGSWGLTALFGAVGAVHLLVFGLFYRVLLRTARRPHPLIVVCLFVACECLPIRFFPWMTGHGAVDCPPLLQSAAWGGVPGVSFVLLCLIVPIHEWLAWAREGDEERSRPGAALVTFLIGAALFGWGHLEYEGVRDDEVEASQRVTIAIVQPDVGAGDKRGAEQGARDRHSLTVQRYRDGSRKALATKPDLIVWPETAITDPIRLMLPSFDANATSGVLRRFGWDFVDEVGSQADLLVGAYERIPTARSMAAGAARADRRHNVAALRVDDPESADPKKATWSVYRKRYLIPFGEAMPLGLPDDALPQRFKMVAADKGQGPLTWRGLSLVPFLCYEGILPEHVRDVAGSERPDLLVSLTNDSWFGDTWEPHQHLNFTRFRAVEHRSPLVRATNTGISAFISATGDVEARLGVGKQGELVRAVPIVNRSRTLFARYGYRLPFVFWGIALLAWLVALGRRRAPWDP